MTQTREREVTFDDNSTINVQNIIWSTGFTPDYKWIDIEGVLDEKVFLFITEVLVQSKDYIILDYRGNIRGISTYLWSGKGC